MSVVAEVYVWEPGYLSEEHPALACETCEGEGTIEVQIPAGRADLERRYRLETCPDCGGDRCLRERWCESCDVDLNPTREGVGAIVERTIERPIFSYAPDGPARRERIYRLLCGPCAHEALMLEQTDPEDLA